MTKLQKLAALPIAGALLLGGGAVAGYAGLASAQTPPATNGTASTTPWGMHKGGRMGGMMGERGVMGTVSAVSGNTVTVTSKDGKTYTIDAASAKVSKVVDLTVSDIKVGDTVGVAGKVSGTSVTAVHIMDGVPPTPQAPPAQ